MRQIKFRAWDNELGEYIHPQDICHLDGETSKGLKESSPFLELEQFTGLHDKNGKEIYEGDIVRHAWESDLTEKCTMIGEDVVKWNHFKARFEIDDWGMIYKKYEVIGNIHEREET